MYSSDSIVSLPLLKVSCSIQGRQNIDKYIRKHLYNNKKQPYHHYIKRQRYFFLSECYRHIFIDKKSLITTISVATRDLPSSALFIFEYIHCFLLPVPDRNVYTLYQEPGLFHLLCLFSSHEAGRIHNLH